MSLLSGCRHFQRHRIRKRGRLGRTGAFFPALWEQPSLSAVCQTALAELSLETSKGWRRQSSWAKAGKDPPPPPPSPPNLVSSGSWSSPDCPRAVHQPLPWPHAWGGIRGRPAGAHFPQLWSAAAQPNTRQHLQLSALKRPKNSD